MKILVVASEPFFVERGTPIAVRLLCESLCEAGHVVELLTYHVGAEIVLPGLTICRIPAVPFIRDIPIGLSVKKIVCDAVLSVKLFARVMRHRYDVIHAVEDAVFPALLARHLGRARLVYDMDSSMADQILRKWTLPGPIRRLLYHMERLAIRGADAVVPVCDYLAERARSCAPGKRVAVLHDVPIESDPHAGSVENLHDICRVRGLLLLYVGNLEHYQGMGLLLEGFARAAPKASVTLAVIGGQAQDIERYRTQAKALGIGDSVYFLGPRPIGNLSMYLRQASILASPRLGGHNPPMKIYSYLAAGKPILATDIGSHTQVLDSSCSVLVSTSAEAIAEGIERLAADEHLRERLGAAAQALVNTKYSLSAYKKTLLGEYAWLDSEITT